MDIELYNKFTFTQDPIKTETPCTAHLASNFLFDRIIDEVLPASLRLDSMDYHTSLEYIEYRVKIDSDYKEKYRDLLISSYLKDYLSFKDDFIYYRWTFSEPQIRVIFIVSILRYLNEQEDAIRNAIDIYTLYITENINFFFPLLSYYLSDNFLGHNLFTEPAYCKGIYFWIDDYLENLCTKQTTTYLEGRGYSQYQPKTLLKKMATERYPNINSQIRFYSFEKYLNYLMDDT